MSPGVKVMRPEGVARDSQARTAGRLLDGGAGRREALRLVETLDVVDRDVAAQRREPVVERDLAVEWTSVGSPPYWPGGRTLYAKSSPADGRGSAARNTIAAIEARGRSRRGGGRAPTPGPPPPGEPDTPPPGPPATATPPPPPGPTPTARPT